jgi:hypothetical protein
MAFRIAVCAVVARRLAHGIAPPSVPRVLPEQLHASLIDF